MARESAMNRQQPLVIRRNDKFHRQVADGTCSLLLTHASTVEQQVFIGMQTWAHPAFRRVADVLIDLSWRPLVMAAPDAPPKFKVKKKQTERIALAFLQWRTLRPVRGVLEVKPLFSCDNWVTARRWRRHLVRSSTRFLILVGTIALRLSPSPSKASGDGTVCNRRTHKFSSLARSCRQSIAPFSLSSRALGVPYLSSLATSGIESTLISTAYLAEPNGYSSLGLNLNPWRRAADTRESMDELSELVATAGGEVIGDGERKKTGGAGRGDIHCALARRVSSPGSAARMTSIRSSSTMNFPPRRAAPWSAKAPRLQSPRSHLAHSRYFRPTRPHAGGKIARYELAQPQRSAPAANAVLGPFNASKGRHRYAG